MAAWNGLPLGALGRHRVVRAVAVHNSVAGPLGKISTTDDGATWTSYTEGTTTWFDVAWSAAEQQFVIVGATGLIRTSPTGASGSWTNRTSGVAQSLQGIARSEVEDTWIAVGALNGGIARILRSTDGAVTWTNIVSTIAVALERVAYSPALDMWIAIGGSQMWRSTDGGLTWTQTTAGLAGLTNFDGIWWSPRQARWVVAEDNGVAYSDDGVNWTAVDFGGGGQRRGIVRSEDLGRWLVVGDLAANVNGNLVQTSDDGATWTNRALGGATAGVGLAAAWVPAFQRFIFGASTEMWYSSTGLAGSWAKGTGHAGSQTNGIAAGIVG